MHKKDNTKPPQPMGSTQNNRLTTMKPPLSSSLSHPGLKCIFSHRGRGEGGLNVFYLYQLFALDSVVVKTQTCLARMEAS